MHSYMESLTDHPRDGKRISLKLFWQISFVYADANCRLTTREPPLVHDCQNPYVHRLISANNWLPSRLRRLLLRTLARWLAWQKWDGPARFL